MFTLFKDKKEILKLDKKSMGSYLLKHEIYENSDSYTLLNEYNESISIDPFVEETLGIETIIED